MLAALAMTALSVGAVLEITLASALRSRAERRRATASTITNLGPVVASDRRPAGTA